jgi:hypothetical protein
MKKILFVFALVLMSVCSFGQKVDVIGDYYNSYTKQKHSVAFSYDYGWMIETSHDTYPNEYYITPYTEQFRQAMTDAKAKYLEWSKVAEENNLSDVDKMMGINFPKGMFMWGSHLAAGSAIPKARFIGSNGKYYCALFFADRFTDLNNRYITTTTYWILSSEEEFDALIEMVSVEKLKEIRSNKNKQDELLK